MATDEQYKENELIHNILLLCFVLFKENTETYFLSTDHKCINCDSGLVVAIGAAFAGLIVLLGAVIGVVIFIRKRKSGEYKMYSGCVLTGR